MNNKTIRLKKLSLDYCLDDSNLHETVADNDIDIDEDGEKDDDDEGNINEIMEIPNVYDHNATARLVLMSPFEERSVRMKKINHGKISLSNIGLNLGLSKERIRQLLLSANTKFIEMNSINIDEELRTKPIDLPCMDLNKR